jgi:tetratricopeptide (TPR) repeat protein
MKLSKESLENLSTLAVILGGIAILIGIVISYTTLNNHVTDLRGEKAEREEQVKKFKTVLDGKIKEFDKKIEELTALQRLLDEKYKNKKWAMKIEATKLFSEGKAHYKKQEYDLAILMLEKALKDRPNNAEILLYLARSYRQNGGLNRALDYIDAAIKLDEKNSNVLLEKGLLLRSREDQDQAILYFKQVIAIEKSQATALYFLSYEYRQKKEYDLALKYTNQRIIFHPKDAQSYSIRAKIYNDLEDYDKAIKDFEKAIELTERKKKTHYPYYTHHKDLLKKVKIKKLQKSSQ